MKKSLKIHCFCTKGAIRSRNRRRTDKLVRKKKQVGEKESTAMEFINNRVMNIKQDGSEIWYSHV